MEIIPDEAKTFDHFLEIVRKHCSTRRSAINCLQASVLTWIGNSLTKTEMEQNAEVILDQNTAGTAMIILGFLIYESTLPKVDDVDVFIGRFKEYYEDVDRKSKLDVSPPDAKTKH